MLTSYDLQDRSAIVGEVSHEIAHDVVQHAQIGEGQTPEQMTANLKALYRIAEEAVSGSLSTEELLHRILDVTIEAVGADRGCILVADPQSGEIVPRVISHREGVDVNSRMPISRSIVDYVVRRGQGVRTSDAQTDQRFDPGRSILQAGIREALCVPMQGRFELMGVIYVDTTTKPQTAESSQPPVHKFDEGELRLLVAIARQSALAVESNRFQQALLKAERLAAMGQTTAILSHHIKNILQGIRGGSYLIDLGLKEHSEDVVRRGWKIVEKNQNKIYHLVMDMLTFSKERQPQWEAGELNATVADVYELMQSRAQDAHVELAWQPAAELPVSMFDSEAIHRAVLNIVINALDAVEEREGARVVLATHYDRPSDALVITVTDNGPGIPPEQLNRIFNVFESSKGARGTGLGLAVSQKIIREHGGDIGIENLEGGGCRLTLSWPLIKDDSRPVGEAKTQM